MSFFNKVRQAIRGKDAEDNVTLALSSDRRLHARFGVLHAPIARLVLANGTTGTVLDISYSGAACRFPADVVLMSHMPARLFVLDNSVEVIISPVRNPAQARDGHVIAGLQILHQKPESLLFLREMIEPIRSGQTAVSIPMDMRKDQYRSADWECLRGEGPVDFIVKLADGKAVEALLTFAVFGAYAELMFKNGTITTGRSTGGSGTITVGASMAQTDDLDHTMVRRAIFILMGLPVGYSKLMEPVLEAALNAIKKSGRVAAA